MVIASHRAVKYQRVRIPYVDSILEQKRSFKYLGVIVGESLSWNSHISYVAFRVYPKLKLLKWISSFLDPTTLLKIYKATILPILDYGFIMWGSCSKKNSDLLERLQNKAMRTILRGKLPDLFTNDRRDKSTLSGALASAAEHHG